MMGLNHLFKPTFVIYIMLSKNIMINGVWQRICLTDEETMDTFDKLLSNNINEFKRCERKAREVKEFSEMPFAEITKMLFDKQATASFTALCDALDDKIYNMRNKTGQVKELDKTGQIIPKYQHDDLQPSLIEREMKKQEVF